MVMGDAVNLSYCDLCHITWGWCGILPYGDASVLSAQYVPNDVRPGSYAAVLPFKWACGWVGLV